MRVFFDKMGIEQVRFKPAYNPYTEVKEMFILSDYRVSDLFPAILGNLRFPPYAPEMG